MNRGVNTKLMGAPVNQSSRDSVFCKYNHRLCTQNCLEGYGFCMRHILEDKTAPYRQCAYITKAGRKCPSAAPKLEKKEGFCSFHTKKAQFARQRLARKRRPKETPDSLLEELVVTASTLDSSNHSAEPRRGKVHSDNIASRALEYASSSDSEVEPLLVEHSWRDSGDSDAESIDSDQEDVLKYAGVYTTEEVAQILRDKLIRLQALYIDQFKRLKHILFTKRRKYLQAQKKDKELFGSIKRYKDDPFQKDKYRKLCAMKRYHKKFGIEALVQHQSTQRRLKVTDGMAHRLPPSPIQCHFEDEGLRCTQTVVPLSKYCQRHILHDQNQVLYRPCPFADSQCGRPVPSLLGNPFCSLHQSLPPTSSSVNIPPEEIKQELEEDEECPLLYDTKPVMGGREEEEEGRSRRVSGNNEQHMQQTTLGPIEEMSIKMEVEESLDEGRGGGGSFRHRAGKIEEEEVIKYAEDVVDDDEEDDDDAHGLR